ncbi:hypothetical protein ACFPER_00485 [Agromyces aurantiacus]|uniref:HNH endonuclease n=1 Tax=Agromyces aurantiacus TaxID=165814 RepID=A0ABV9R1K0_9MICO|nr:hypothetical protein [Agromyces aurantiacus]MBM7505560.1 hypothetical protein [Agromyces aurantiacus]
MTRTKRCGRCQQSKPTSEYNRRSRSRDGLQPFCRECNRENARAYYARNREAHVRRIVASKGERRARALELVGRHLITHPCVDCGEDDIRVLDFDHRDSAEKGAEVMKLAQDGHALQRIAAEVAKCDVRCRNCHAIVTYQRMESDWRSAMRLRAMAEAAAFLRAGVG